MGYQIEKRKYRELPLVKRTSFHPLVPQSTDGIWIERRSFHVLNCVNPRVKYGKFPLKLYFCANRMTMHACGGTVCGHLTLMLPNLLPRLKCALLHVDAPTRQPFSRPYHPVTRLKFDSMPPKLVKTILKKVSFSSFFLRLLCCVTGRDVEQSCIQPTKTINCRLPNQTERDCADALLGL